MENVIKYLEDNHHKKLYFTETGCNLMNLAQEMLTIERVIIREEKKIIIPGMQLYTVNDENVDAFTTKIDGVYYIFVNKGVIETQKTYLESLHWSFLDDEPNQRIEYIGKLIEYGWLFTVFHEYAHIFCGHNDAGLGSAMDKKAQECEADMFSMDYLINYIMQNNPIEKYVEELEKLFLAVYFLIDNMQKKRVEEWYNDRLIQNYYDPDKIEKRGHPLSAQRMLYLFEMMNVVVVTDKVQILPTKENILGKLKLIKGIEDDQIPESRQSDYTIVQGSIEELKKSLQEIRVKIPRIGDSAQDGDNENNEKTE